MQENEIICIVCPVGCNIIVRAEGGHVQSIEGFSCKRGEEYAFSEYTHPVRILTSTAKVEGGKVPLAPVRSNKPVPKELLFQCMEEIRKLKVRTPIRSRDVVIPNILGTGIDIVASCSLES